MNESNPEQTLADIEGEYEAAKLTRRQKRDALRAARGRYHAELVLRREAGEKLTIADIQALENVAIDSVDYVRNAYLEFGEAESNFSIKSVALNQATRDYWDSKPLKYGPSK